MGDVSICDSWDGMRDDEEKGEDEGDHAQDPVSQEVSHFVFLPSRVVEQSKEIQQE